jgi:hypothetical protein
MTIEEFQEIHRIITRLKAKECQIAYSEASGYSITTKDNKHIRFITHEEYKLIERLILPQ